MEFFYLVCLTLASNVRMPSPKSVPACNRNFSTLESLKHSGITQRELCLLIVHILRIVSATVTFEYDQNNQKKKAILHYENVGYIWNGVEEHYENVDQPQQLEDELRYTFALPSPAREALLSVLISIMSKKSCLRGSPMHPCIRNQATRNAFCSSSTGKHYCEHC
jgi:hypothetical protein